MLSPVDVGILGAIALILFGPEQFPKVARKAGQVVRELQNTSQSFIREIERAAEDPAPPVKPYESPHPDPFEAEFAATHEIEPEAANASADAQATPAAAMEPSPSAVAEAAPIAAADAAPADAEEHGAEPEAPRVATGPT